MVYRKFAADRIFTGDGFAPREFVLVTDEHGSIVDLVKPDSDHGIEFNHGIICPGFVNVHCHLELSYLKGVIPRDSGMADFLITVMDSRHGVPNGHEQAMRDAELELMRGGTVAVGDICNSIRTISLKEEGKLYYHNFIEAMGVVEAFSGERYAQAVQIYNAFVSATNIASGRSLTASLVPHAPYSVSPGLFTLINEHQPGSILTMHSQESDAESQLFLHGIGGLLRVYEKLGIDLRQIRSPGMTSLQSCAGKFSRDHSLILVHNVATAEKDLEWIHSQLEVLPKLYFCLCPRANLYIGNGLPDVDLFRRHRLNMVIGTDSLASNDSLDMLGEIKTLKSHFPAIPLTELLTWATRNGASALRIQQHYGSFEPGKRPGVILIGGIEGDDITNAGATRLL